MPSLALGLGLSKNKTAVYSGLKLDPQAQAFITAAGITDPTQINAINFLFTSLKGVNTSYNPTALDIYTDLTSFYPVAGGSASSHKFNGKNPVDSDAAYRLVFSGGWTHSSNGMLPNGVNAYANTFLAPSAFNQNSICAGYYSRINSANTGRDFGAGVNFYPNIKFSDNTFYWQVNGALDSVALGATTSQGLFSINRTGLSVSNGWRNTTKNAGVATSNAPTSDTIFVGARNNGGSAANFGNRECAFFYVSIGLSDDKLTALYNIVQQYQTILGRNV